MTHSVSGIVPVALFALLYLTLKKKKTKQTMYEMVLPLLTSENQADFGEMGNGKVERER